MEFPDLALVKLTPRDLTGPGIEFYARRLGSSFATASGSAILAADQLSSERLYMLKWAWSLFPSSLINHALNARWYLQLGNADIQLYGAEFEGIKNDANNKTRVDGNSPFFVIPGGKSLLFVADFNQAAATNSFDSWLWGYSFPKGNVLSF